jgi:peptide/nickel transport system permease protein
MSRPPSSIEPELAGASPAGSAALLEQSVDVAERAGIPELAVRSHARLVVRRFLRHRLAVASLVLLGVLALAAVFADALAPYPLDPDLTDPAVLEQARESPSLDHWFGTDKAGVDQFTRVLFALRVSLVVGVTTALLATVLGTAVGALAGYRGGWVDGALMRLTDLALILPTVAVLLILADRLGSSVPGMILALSLLSWMAMARIVRGEVLALREQDFVEAARASGASNIRIVVRHVLPNALGPIIVFATLLVGITILTEALLSFLGAGIQSPDVSLGTLISEAESSAGTSLAYLVYFPGLVLFVLVLAINFVGDGLRDALDPRVSR